MIVYCGLPNSAFHLMVGGEPRIFVLACNADG